MQDIGVAGMVRTGIWCERVLGAEVLSMGRSQNDYLAREDCVMELVGAQLYYRVALRGGWIWIRAAGLDEGDLPPLFNVGDGPQGWTDVRRFIQAVERSGIKSLKTLLNTMGCVLESRAAIASERTTHGMARAKRRGVKLGRPCILDAHRGEVAGLRAAGMSGRAIAKELGLPVGSVFGILRAIV